MASTLVKSPDQIRMEILINNFGYILLQLFLLIMKITFVVVVIAAKLLRLPTIYTVLSAWLYPTTFARRTRLACKFVSHCVSPWTVYAVFFTFGPLPIVVGATLEQNGPELELLQVQIKALARPYLPATCFVVGIVITYTVLRLLPGYDETCSSINSTLHAPKSVMEILDHKFLPGEFPAAPFRNILDEFKDLLLKKDGEIARLNKSLRDEDEELVELMAQKDEEISKYQTTLQQKDKVISDLRAVKLPLIQPPISTAVPSPVPLRRIPNESTKNLTRQLGAALAYKAEMQEKVSSLEKQADALRKENSELRTKNASFLRPPSSLFKECHDQIIALKGQLSQCEIDAANERQSLTAQHDQLVSDLQAELSRRDTAATTDAQHLIAHLTQQVTDLQAQLSKCNLDLAGAQQANSGLQTQIIDNESAFADLRRNFDAREERLNYLESQCVKANKMYEDYMKLLAEYDKLRQERQANGQANAAAAELDAAKERIAKLVKANEQLEAKLRSPGLVNIASKIALEDQEKRFERTRQMLQENLNAIRMGGGPSSRFLEMHHNLKKERDDLHAQKQRLHGKYYALEIKAANLQARERTLTNQLQRFKDYNTPTGRDAAFQRSEELVIRSQEALEAALGSVDWQLQARTNQEREQRCKDLGEDLGMRLRPLLEKMGEQVEKLESVERWQRGQEATRETLEKIKDSRIAALEREVKRKAEADEEEEGGKKRPHHG